MRKLIMWNVVTLDGHFEGPHKWEIDWHDTAWGPDLETFSAEQLRAADLLLFGRITYEGMASYWPAADGEVADLMNGIQKVVFSSTLGEPAWANTRLVRGPAADEVARLKSEPGKDILIFGSGELTAALTARGLIDEYRLGIAPIVLGEGNPLFKPLPARLRMQLLEAKPLDTAGGCASSTN